MSFLRSYGQRVTNSPLVTESLMTSFLFGLGDVASQQLVERKESHDFVRTGRFLVFGGLVAGPLLSTWYGVLNKKVVLANPFAQLCTRVAMDQLLFTPVFISTFTTGMSLLEGKDFRDLASKLRDTFLPTWAANIKLWTPFQFINFYITPPAYRLLAVNVTATGWNTYLSFTNSRANRRLEKGKTTSVASH